jgi:hypothetical protein
MHMPPEGHLGRGRGLDRRGGNRGPHVAFGVSHAAVPGRADQQVDPGQAVALPAGRHIGFPVTRADKARLRTRAVYCQDHLDTHQLLLAFLLGNRPLLAGDPLAAVLGSTGRPLLGEHAQGHLSGVHASAGWTCKPQCAGYLKGPKPVVTGWQAQSSSAVFCTANTSGAAATHGRVAPAWLWRTSCGSRAAVSKKR